MKALCECGHPREDHYQRHDMCLFHPPQAIGKRLRVDCPCERFVRAEPLTDPLMIELEAIVEGWWVDDDVDVDELLDRLRALFGENPFIVTRAIFDVPMLLEPGQYYMLDSSP